MLEARLPRLAAAQVESWQLLFDLAEELPGWALVGAQMVVLHAAARGVARPEPTRDADVLVDVRATSPSRIVEWLRERGFELAGVNAFDVGHKFVRGTLEIDVLSIDHTGERADLTTVPPAHTVEVPGGRSASRRLTDVRISSEDLEGCVRIPDWPGALALKARATEAFVDEREKHLGDLALLLALPVDLRAEIATMDRGQRLQIARSADRIDEGIWRSVSVAVDSRAGKAAAALIDPGHGSG